MRAARWIFATLALLVAAAPSAAQVPFVRTPDARFAGLPEYPFAPNYLFVDGLRMHYIEAGGANDPVILLLHGEPSWSFLYRKMIPILAAAGYRVIAPDLIGFGRSDKPIDRNDYTHQKHVDWVTELIETLDLNGITLVCQDWGGLIGLRLVTDLPDRFDRVVAANTGLPSGPPITLPLPAHPRPGGWGFAEWLAYSQGDPDFDIGFVADDLATETVLSEAVKDGYRAPFPDETYKAGARVFPTLVNSEPIQNSAAWDDLVRLDEPFLTLFSDGDRITWRSEQRFIEHVPGAIGQPHFVIGGGHFLQEDNGVELADRIVAWLSGPTAQPLCASLDRSRLVVKKLDAPPGGQKLLVRGEMVLAHPFDPSFDPLVNGVRLVVSDSQGRALATRIAGGVYSPATGLGWTVNASGTRWRYRNTNAGAPGGITRVVIRDKSAKTPGLIKVTVRGKDADYTFDPAALPLRATLVVDPPAATTGQCARRDFATSPTGCVLARNGTRVVCR